MFQALLSKAGVYLGGRAFFALLIKVGFSGGLSLAICCAVKALFTSAVEPSLSLMGNGFPANQAPELPPAPAIALPVEIPELEQPLIPDLERDRELYDRLLFLSVGQEQNNDLHRIVEIVRLQSMIERRVEAALVHDGFDPQSLIFNRHRIRGFIFYPRGYAFSIETYRSYLNQISRLGTRETRLYQRVWRAIRNYDLLL